MTYKIKSGFIIREIGGNVMAVPTGTQTSEIHGMIALSESGALLWKELENGADINALAKALTDNYEIDDATALADAEKFVDSLKEQGALV
ncbi:MAG: PqqD family protein [Clostridia bacterium]|nr:PqqD family protein [Clostridia bacterium]